MQRLPSRYRAPLILCYWEDRTRDEAALQLGWSLGMLKRRLERGRKLLRDRLTRRGLVIGIPLFAGLVIQDTASAVSASLVEATARAAVAFAGGQPAGAASGSAIGLAQKGLAEMFLIKVKMAVAVLVAVGTVLSGVSVLNRRPLYPLQPVAALEETRQPGSDAPRTAQTPAVPQAHGPQPCKGVGRQRVPVRIGPCDAVRNVAFLPSGKSLMSARVAETVQFLSSGGIPDADLVPVRR